MPDILNKNGMQFRKQRDDIEPGLYTYTIKKHTVYFRETKQEFVVLRILHSRMDPELHLL